MRKRLLFVLLLLTVVWLPAVAQNNSAPASAATIYTVVEQQPKFTGGTSQLSSYLRKNIRYPQVDHKERRRGRVFVNFVVTDTGAIEDVKTLNSLGPAYDEEAIRLVKEMPQWIPGRQGGKPVYCRYNLPINF